MAAGFELDPYDPCPCGSGKKYKFCCAEKHKANRHGKFPVGTIIYYGPDDKTITKIAAAVLMHEHAEPIVERFLGENIASDTGAAEKIKKFFASHGVKNVVASSGVNGCPHEEGIDFPEGQDCPHCPFWAGMQGTARFSNHREVEAQELESQEDADEEQTADDDDDDPDFVTAEDADAAFERFEAVLTDAQMDREQAIAKVAEYLQANLQLPCEVTGGEDFQWEERYVIGGWSPREYAQLKKTQPSYRDRFQLLSISCNKSSDWMMFEEDIAARVRRISDGKRFDLGLCELEATDQNSQNYELIRDYAIWFVNSR
jgi:hypothetical protein